MEYLTQAWHFVATFDQNTQATWILIGPQKHFIPWSFAFFYILMLYVIPKVITRPVKLAEILFPYWNLLLSIYSGLTFFGTVYSLSYHLPKYGIYGTLCDVRVVNTPHLVAFLSYTFTLSKLVELGDTLFLLLKHPERPIEVLHWWHHVSVMLFFLVLCCVEIWCGLPFYAYEQLCAYVHVLVLFPNVHWE